MLTAMMRTRTAETTRRFGMAGAVVLSVAGLALAGCKSKVDDSALTTAVQNQLNGDSALSGQAIQTSVSGGVVTLAGTVSNDAQRTIAARDAAYVAGVKKVVDTITIVPAAAGITAATTANLSAPPPPPSPPPPAPLAKRSPVTQQAAPPPSPPPPAASAPAPPPATAPEQQHEPAPIERNGQTYTPPAFVNVTIPSGNTVAVRVTQTLDSATAQQGQEFTGVTASDIVIDGLVALPAGSPVVGHVDAVQEAAHYKGASLLSVSLSSVTRRGDRIPVSTEDYTIEGKARGKNTAEKVGGGAAVGAILGGIFGGGKGAAIGAAAGGGVGAGANTITRGQQVQIESESVVRFRLTAPITVKVKTDAGDRDDRHPLPPG